MNIVYMLVIALLFSSTVQSQEVLTYEEMERCDYLSQQYEDKEDRLLRQKENVGNLSRQISNLDSKLKGIDWDYNNAMHSLEMCRIRNNNDDRYCNYEFNRADSLAVQFNNTLDDMKGVERRYNNLADEYNSNITSFRRLASRLDQQCFEKRFSIDNVKRVCGNSNTIFCNSIEQ